MKPYRRLEKLTPVGDGYPSIDVLLHGPGLTPPAEAVAQVPIFVQLVADRRRDLLDKERKATEDEAKAAAERKAAEDEAKERGARLTAIQRGWDRARAERGRPTEAELRAEATTVAYETPATAWTEEMLGRVRDGLYALV